MKRRNLLDVEEEINRLLPDDGSDEVENTPYEKDITSKSEFDDCDDDLTWEPDDQTESIAEKLQAHMKKL
ncbi:hypothetical protein J6590_008312 [Homalodisca vitripennis]|nr:hypothetical protein J6590_008312 [Homalodisca vitripennis]